MRNIIEIGDMYVDLDKVVFITPVIASGLIQAISIHIEGMRTFSDGNYDNKEGIGYITLGEEGKNIFLEKWKKYLEQNNNKNL